MHPVPSEDFLRDVSDKEYATARDSFRKLMKNSLHLEKLLDHDDSGDVRCEVFRFKSQNSDGTSSRDKLRVSNC
jgi:hypothetical protein